MTAPFAAVGAGQAPAPFEMLGAAPASVNGAASPADDAARAKFAGLLARVMDAKDARDADTAARESADMVEAALASLDAALAESTQRANAGTEAIRALIAQVAKQGAADAAVVTAQAAAAATAATATTATQAADALAQALGAAAAIAPPITPTTQQAPTATKDLSQAATASDEDAQAAKTDAENAANAANPDGLAATTTTVDPNAIVREAGALDAAFRAKLDRVIERMQNEFGHKVTVVETVRSQTRQDALFEQGRTAPGQVVTWTRTSRHADGLAADVMIDGGYDNVVAFERLQRIANEEGIHTLGAKDPGHLEWRTPQAGGFTAKVSSVIAQQPSLPAPPPVANAATAETRASREAFARLARVAHVAEVAMQAGVARVASVARVATAASTAASASAAAATKAANDTQALNAANALAGKTPAPAPVPAMAAQGAGAIAQQSTREQSSDGGPRTPRRTIETGSAGGSEASALPFITQPRGTGSLAAVQAASGPDQASRVGQIDAMHAQTEAQPMSSMVLTMDDGNGGTDRIRVDVRGTSVSSAIDVRDQQAATELSARTADLARALESRGLESEGVRVRAVGAPLNADALRHAVGESATTRSLAGALAAEAANPSKRDRDDARDPRTAWTQQEQDTNRQQRSRREREEQQP